MLTCPACGGNQIFPFLSRKDVPVHQNLVLATRSAARDVARGDLEMVACENCGFVFNAAFDESLLSYGENYDNAQGHSGFFSAYVDELVTRLVREGVNNCHVVEVGCGKGEFLRRLVEYPDSGISASGYDPSYLGPDVELGGRLRFYREFYGPATAKIPADAVVCRHVIEHIAQPVDLLRTVRSTLHGSEPLVFFETPSIEWILENRVIWDFFYEHCSLFSAAAMRAAFSAAGIEVTVLDRVFGGQYFWLEGRPANERTATSYDSSVGQLARAFAEQYPSKVADALACLRALRKQGPVALWGAGAKGTAFANLIDPDCTLVECLVDLNPGKQGHFVPGSGHPILAPTALKDINVRNVILMNPNYYQEVSGLIRTLGIACQLVVLE